MSQIVTPDAVRVNTHLCPAASCVPIGKLRLQHAPHRLTAESAESILSLVPTATRQLIEVRLGRDLDEWVNERRDTGLGWRLLARALTERTNVNVSHETLRRWCS